MRRASGARKAGKPRIFERNATIGGAVQTGEFTLPGFRHDFGAMNLSLFAGSAFHRKYANELKTHGLEFAPVADCFASAFPDGRWFGVSNDLEKTASRIAAFSPADADDMAPPGRGLPGRGRASVPAARLADDARARWPAPPGTLWRKKGVAGALDTVRLLLVLAARLARREFRVAACQGDARRLGHASRFRARHRRRRGVPLSGIDGQPEFRHGARQGRRRHHDPRAGRHGRRRPAARSSPEPRWPRSRFPAARRPACGSLPARPIPRRKAVIAGVAPGALAGKLLPNGSGDAGFDTAMKKFRHAPGTMMIHLALDDLPDWRAGAELRQFAYVHLAPSLDAMARTYQQAMAGLLPDEPVLVVGQPTAIDPSRAPAGKHVLWVQVRMLPAEIAGRCGRQDRARSLGPGQGALRRPRHRHHRDATRPVFAQKILGRAVFSPIDLERENPNLVGGDQICGSHHLAQNFLFRPARGFAGWNTPVGESASHRCRDMAGRRHRCGIGLHARATAWREVDRRFRHEAEGAGKARLPKEPEPMIGQTPRKRQTQKGNDHDNQQTRIARIQRRGARRGRASACRRSPRPSAAN